jgi:S1-C subfamily serine protease
VIQDSPAFRANILEGDIIIQIADKPVAMPQDLIGILPQYAGQKVPMKVLRSGKELDIDVQLNGNG